MSTRWWSLMPNDRYVVCRNESVSPAHIGYLIHYYQPIIGSSALSLYLTLMQEIPLDQVGPGKPETHRWLLTATKLSMEDWLEARYALEAVGLVRVYRCEQPQIEETIYEYRVIPPLGPAEFFQSDIFSLMLLNRVGQYKFREIRGRYIAAATEEHNGKVRRQETTKRFDEVFTSLSPSEIQAHKGSEQEKVMLESEKLFGEHVGDERVDDSYRSPQVTLLDVALLRSLISPVFEPHREVSKEIMPHLAEIAFLFQLDEMQMAYFIEHPEVYDNEGRLDLDRLRRAVKDWYKKHHFDTPVVVKREISHRADESKKERGGSEDELLSAKSDFTQHILRLEKISPLRLLEVYHGEAKIASSDIELVESLLTEYQLTPPVVNVLLEYVLITQQRKLPRPLVEKIASHWKRLKLATADEACRMAVQMYKQWSSEGGKRMSQGSGASGTSAAKGRHVAKRDKLPQWVQAQLEAEQSISTAQRESASGNEGSVSADQEKRSIELLRALGELD